MKRIQVVLTAATLTGVLGVSIATAGSSPSSASSASSGSSAAYHPVLDPAHFVSVIDNPYYPLPVGRTLIYRGVKDGTGQTERVHVTSRTTVIEGITATVVTDVAKHHDRVLERTADWFAQDDQGNVWYLGENTKAYEPDGTVDTSGSWRAGVDGAQPGIVMEADPRVPDAYRQEYLKGEAEDTAWIVDRGGSLTVPYGTVHHVLTSLEYARIEPDVIDEKDYAPGIGIVLETARDGEAEVARLVRVID
jgi:hypothetical protein